MKVIRRLNYMSMTMGFDKWRDYVASCREWLEREELLGRKMQRFTERRTRRVLMNIVVCLASVCV